MKRIAILCLFVLMLPYAHIDSFANANVPYLLKQVWFSDNTDLLSIADRLIVTRSNVNQKVVIDCISIDNGNSIYSGDNDLKTLTKYDGDINLKSSYPVYDGKIFINLLDNNSEIRIYCFSLSSGGLLWISQDKCLRLPTIFENNIAYTTKVGSSDNSIYGVNVSTGKTIWKKIPFPLIECDNDYISIKGVTNNSILISKRYLYLCETKSMKVVWHSRNKSCHYEQIDIEKPYYGYVKVCKDKVISVDTNCTIKPTDNEVIGKSLYVTDINTGKDIWQTECYSKLFCIDNDIIYYLWRNNTNESKNIIFARSLSNGSLIWQKEIDIRWAKHYAIRNNQLLLIGKQVKNNNITNSILFRIDVATGELISTNEFENDFTEAYFIDDYIITSNDPTDYLSNSDTFNVGCYQILND